MAPAPRRFKEAGGPSGPSTQHAPGLDEEEDEEVVCLEERWVGEEAESKVSAGIRRRRWRPKSRHERIIKQWDSYWPEFITR